MIPQFHELLTRIESSGIVVETIDDDAEPLGNMCSVSVTNAQSATLTADDIVRFIYQAAHAFDRLRQLKCPNHCMIFYCWIDEQAGQLRFSVVSSLPLPFGCTIRKTDDASKVARQLLTCGTLEGIPLREMQPVRTEDLANEPDNDADKFGLDVFTCNLPIACAVSGQSI